MYTNNTAKTKQRFICSEENCVQHRTPTLATLNTREREKQREKSFVERRERETEKREKTERERNNHIYRVSLLSFSFVVLRSGIMGFITSA